LPLCSYRNFQWLILQHQTALLLLAERHL
jgi:hypothetical protein